MSTRDAGRGAAERPRVSVIVPCRNEERHIGACLDSILAGDYPPGRLEVLVVDGMSDDGTRRVVAEYAARHAAIRLLDNPRRITPTAMNIAVRASTGDVVVRMDAHVVYPRDYIARLVTIQEEEGADNVGGVIVTLPGEDTATARAIAIALSHRFGVGNSYFRIGTTERRWVDTVAFGCFRREIFSRVGMFDEELVRNQDEEFNFRVLRNGGRILLVPDVVARYYARASLGKVARMFYQYGYFKPLVARKIGRVMTLRQVVPSLFVLGLGGTAVLQFLTPVAGALFAGIAGIYAAAAVACSARAAARHGVRCGAVLASVFPVLHVSYGVGCLAGILDHFVLAGLRVRDVTAIPLSR
jgi:glycosyltransferase involved in cell wall biosynthesis